MVSKECVSVGSKGIKQKCVDVMRDTGGLTP